MFPIRRVLVIDDDEMMRDLLEAILPMDGYEVNSVGDGEEAVHLVGLSPSVDLVLMDLHMPGLEGRALITALRSAAPAGTLLVGMSGSDPDTPVRGALDAFLLKPFDSQALQQAIESAQNARTAEDPRSSLASSFQSTAAPKEKSPLEPLDSEIFDSLSRVIPLGQLGDLYELALNDIAKRLERIRHAVSAGDLTSAQREAHAIKGSCGMVGAAELQSLAAAIEDGTIVNTSAIAQIPSACLRLRRMLDAKLQPV